MSYNKAVLIPSLSGLLFGYNSVIIAGAQLFITFQFSLTPLQEGAIVASCFLGTCLGCFFGILSNYAGRKKILLASALLFILGGALSALAPNYYLLIFARFVIGLASGMATTVSATYLVEVASSESRGSILNLNQIGTAIGMLGAYFCSYALAFSGSWRLMFGLGLIPAIVQFFGLFTISDSCSKEELSKKTVGVSWKSVWEEKNRSRLKFIIVLILFQALAGSSAIFCFAPRVFENCGFEDSQGALLASLSIGVVYLIAVLISFFLIDRIGRRPLFFISYGGMATSLLTITSTNYIKTPNSELIALVSILFYIAFYAIGAGPIPPLLIGEISPLNLRAHLTTTAGVVGWLTNYFIILTFLSLTNIFGIAAVFAIYSSFCLVGFLIFFKILPETSQKSLKEISQLF